MPVFMAAKAYFILQIFNEEDSVLSVIESIVRSPALTAWDVRILAVNDGSSDKSLLVLTEAAKMYPVHTITHETRQGMPLSFKSAFAYLEPFLEDDDVVFTMEADATNDIACVPHMLQEISAGEDVVIASRYAPGAVSLGFPWYRLWGSEVINLFLRLVWNVPHVKDYSVLYRVYRGALLRRYFQDKTPFRARKSFAVIAEILLHVSRYTNRFSEVPLRYDYGLKKGKSKMKLLQTLWEYTRITPRTPFRKQPLFWVALGSLCAYLAGIMYGFPDLVVLDEPALTRGALTMLKLKTLLPVLHPAEFATLYYPPVTAYLYLIVLAPVMLVGYILSHAPSLSAYATQLILDPTIPWVATRALTAVIAAVGVYMIGRVAERMFAGSGIFAALFLATSFLYVTFAHIARHWTPSFLLIICLIWVGYHIFHTGQKRWYVLAGVFSGLAVGTGVITGVLAVVPLLAHFFRTEPLRTKIKSGAFWIFIALAAFLSTLFLAAHPLVVYNLFAGENQQGITIAGQKSLLGLVEIYVTELRDLAQSETMLLFFGLLGIPLFLQKHKRFGAVLILSLFITVLVVYVFHYYLLHYLALLIPTLAVFAGAAVASLLRIAKNTWLRGLMIVCIFALPLSITLRFSYLWMQPDTRHDARAYIAQHIPADARILSYIPNMKVVWPTPDSITERLAFDPLSERLVDRTLLGLSAHDYPRPAFSVFELGTMSEAGALELKEALASKKFDYVVIDRSATKIPLVDSLIEKGELIARFPKEGTMMSIIANEFQGPAFLAFSIPQMGPEVWILKLPK